MEKLVCFGTSNKEKTSGVAGDPRSKFLAKTLRNNSNKEKTSGVAGDPRSNIFGETLSKKGKNSRSKITKKIQRKKIKTAGSQETHAQIFSTKYLEKSEKKGKKVKKTNREFYERKSLFRDPKDLSYRGSAGQNFTDLSILRVFSQKRNDDKKQTDDNEKNENDEANKHVNMNK